MKSPPGKGKGAMLPAPIHKKLRLAQPNSGSGLAQVREPPGRTHFAKEICSECGTFVRWLPKPANVERQRSNVFRIAKLSMQEGLTRWERKFLRSIAHQNRLSPRQQQILDELAEKHLEHRNHPPH